MFTYRKRRPLLWNFITNFITYIVFKVLRKVTFQLNLSEFLIYCSSSKMKRRDLQTETEFTTKMSTHFPIADRMHFRRRNSTKRRKPREACRMQAVPPPRLLLSRPACSLRSHQSETELSLLNFMLFNIEKVEHWKLLISGNFYSLQTDFNSCIPLLSYWSLNVIDYFELLSKYLTGGLLWK